MPHHRDGARRSVIEEVAMKYLVPLLGEGELPSWSSMSEEEQAAGVQRFEGFDAACAAREGVQLLSGEALAEPSSVTTIRTRGGQQAVTEGPTPKSSKAWALPDRGS